MAGMELGQAFVQIIPSAEGIEGKITQALGGEVSSAGEKSGKGFSSALAKGLIGGAAAVGTAAAGMVTGIVNGAKGVAEYGDNIDKMSQKIGISAESYQKWDYVMQRAGTSVDNLKAGMKTLSTAAESGSDAFDKLGISQEQIASMSHEQLLEATIKGLSGMEEGAERTALATQLLGKAGMDLGPLLNEGTEAIEEQMKMAEDYGMIMSDESIAASAAFQDSMTTLQMTLGGVKNSLLSEFLPSMTEVTDGLAMVMSGDQGGVALISQGIQDFINNISQMLPTLAEVGGQLLQTLGQAIMDHLPELVTVATNLIVNFVMYIVQNLPQILSAAVQIITALGSGLLQALPALGTSILQIINAMIQPLKNAVTQFLSIGGDIMRGLANGIKSGASAVVDGIKNTVKNAIDTAKNFLGIKSPSKVFRDEIGKNMMLGMAEGILQNQKSVEDALGGITMDAVASVKQNVVLDTSTLYGESSIGSKSGRTSGTVVNQTLNIYSPRELTPSEVARQTRNATQQMVLSIGV